MLRNRQVAQRSLLQQREHGEAAPMGATDLVALRRERQMHRLLQPRISRHFERQLLPHPGHRTAELSPHHFLYREDGVTGHRGVAPARAPKRALPPPKGAKVLVALLLVRHGWFHRACSRILLGGLTDPPLFPGSLPHQGGRKAATMPDSGAELSTSQPIVAETDSRGILPDADRARRSVRPASPGILPYPGYPARGELLA